MSPDERAAMHRVRAAHLRVQAAGEDLMAAVCVAAGAFREFTAAFTVSEVREVQQHPDLAELDCQLDGFYGTFGSGGGQWEFHSGCRNA
jgi:hypothetical protein